MWTTKFNQDTEVEGVGTITAQNGEFSYSERIDTNVAPEVDAFVDRAKDKFKDKQTIIVEVIAPIEESITSKLNEEE